MPQKYNLISWIIRKYILNKCVNQNSFQIIELIFDNFEMKNIDDSLLRSDKRIINTITCHLIIINASS